MKLIWDGSAWEDYLWWQENGRRVLRRINQLLTDVQRNGNSGIGKPQPLRHALSGFWSRRITDEHRLVHRIENDAILVASCRYHYEWISRRAEGARRARCAGAAATSASPPRRRPAPAVLRDQLSPRVRSRRLSPLRWGAGRPTAVVQGSSTGESQQA